MLELIQNLESLIKISGQQIIIAETANFLDSVEMVPAKAFATLLSLEQNLMIEGTNPSLLQVSHLTHLQ